MEKEYGRHNYPPLDPTYLDHKIECSHGCGCWVDSGKEGGPPGLEPRGGLCPKNPVDGHLLGGDLDYRYVVEQRIKEAEDRAEKAEREHPSISPSAKWLENQLTRTRQKLANRDAQLFEIRQILRRKKKREID